jgi:hypothetical protein
MKKNPYTVLNLQAAASATNTNSLERETIGELTVALCVVKPTVALTEVVAKVTMSDNDSDFYPIFDEAGDELSFTISSIGYSRLKPSDYAVFAKYIRLEFAAGISADAEFELHFRPVN